MIQLIFMLYFDFCRKDRRFLVTDPMQFILIEPDVKRLGWGIVKFCDLMQVSILISHLRQSKHDVYA
jgi:protein CLEC16A